MTPSAAPLDADVLIAGLGPVGQLLATLLGQLGVRVIAVDAAHEPYDLPRAAVIDDEVLRIFQSIDLDRAILADSQRQQRVTYRTRRGRSIDIMRPVAEPFGQPPLVSIHQPSIERTLVAALRRFPSVETRWGTHVERCEQAADHATLWIRPAADGRHEVATAVRGRWLVACDGGRSPIREQLGIEFGGSTFRQRWLVVDARVDRPVAAAPHPHFVGDPERPTVSLPMSPGRHRWEWMVHPHEASEPFEQPERVRALLQPWLGGARADVERAVVYTFHARMARRWRIGRVLLAGDAAHLMPPFIGQGFSSGARDAANLAWKLDAVLRGAPDRLIDTYEEERRPHVASMQTLAVRWGSVLQTADPRIALIRDVVLGGLQRSGILAIARDRLKPMPTVASGAFARRPRRIPALRTVGTLFPQPAGDGDARLDEVLGAGWAVLALDASTAARARAAGVRAFVVGSDLPDPSGTIRRWLTRRHATWVCLRPDRFVFDCGRADGLGRLSSALTRHLGPSALRASAADRQHTGAPT